MLDVDPADVRGSVAAAAPARAAIPTPGGSSCPSGVVAAGGHTSSTATGVPSGPTRALDGPRRVDVARQHERGAAAGSASAVGHPRPLGLVAVPLVGVDRRARRRPRTSPGSTWSSRPRAPAISQLAHDGPAGEQQPRRRRVGEPRRGATTAAPRRASTGRGRRPERGPSAPPVRRGRRPASRCTRGGRDDPASKRPPRRARGRRRRPGAWGGTPGGRVAAAEHPVVPRALLLSSWVLAPLAARRCRRSRGRPRSPPSGGRHAAPGGRRRAGAGRGGRR